MKKTIPSFKRQDIMLPLEIQVSPATRITYYSPENKQYQTPYIIRELSRRIWENYRGFR